MVAVSLGSQLPRVTSGPKSRVSDADDCVFLASAYGLVPDPWQAHVLSTWMGRKPDGRWAAGRWGIAVPRQNGKNGILEMVELFFMVELGLKILHTAHEVKTARKAFLRIASFFENPRKFPELAELVKEVRKTNGQEAIVLHNGGSVEFIARSKGSGRGFTVDVLVCDEAQEYSEDAQAALLPTISSAPSGDPLQILLGTPPGPGMSGDVFTRMRSAGQDGKDKRLAWCEWSVVGKFRPADRAVWAGTNPSLGLRLNLTTLEDEFAGMSPDMFARERLGKWDADGFSKAFSASGWDSLCVDRSEIPGDGRRAYAVRFSPDGSMVSLAQALRPDYGAVHVQAVRSAPISEGTTWLVDWLAERAHKAAQIVVDGKSGVGYLVQALHDEKVKKVAILTPTVDQVIAAHSMFDESVRSGKVSHIGQEPLDLQVKGATKRKIGSGGGFGWEPPQGGSTGLLDAVTMAHWAAKTTTRRPGRKAGFL